MSHDGSSCKSYIKHPTEKERLDNLAFTSFPEDYLPYASSYREGGKAPPYLVWDERRPRKSRKRRRGCCSTAALVSAIALIVAAILAVVAISVYLGVVTNLFRSPVLSLSGKFRVSEGDEFLDELLNNTSYQFLIKAETYQAMVENVFLSSSLEPAFIAARIYAFRPGMLVFFRVYLDRRKLQQDDSRTLQLVKTLVRSDSPAFGALTIDQESVDVDENEEWISVPGIEQRITKMSTQHPKTTSLAATKSTHSHLPAPKLTTASNNKLTPLTRRPGRPPTTSPTATTPVITPGSGNPVPVQGVSRTGTGEVVAIGAISPEEDTLHFSYGQWKPVPIEDSVSPSFGDQRTPPGRGSVRLLEESINSPSRPSSSVGVGSINPPLRTSSSIGVSSINQPSRSSSSVGVSSINPPPVGISSIGGTSINQPSRPSSSIGVDSSNPVNRPSPFNPLHVGVGSVSVLEDPLSHVDPAPIPIRTGRPLRPIISDSHLNGEVASSIMSSVSLVVHPSNKKNRTSNPENGKLKMAKPIEDKVELPFRHAAIQSNDQAIVSRKDHASYRFLDEIEDIVSGDGMKSTEGDLFVSEDFSGATLDEIEEPFHHQEKVFQGGTSTEPSDSNMGEDSFVSLKTLTESSIEYLEHETVKEIEEYLDRTSTAAINESEITEFQIHVSSTEKNTVSSESSSPLTTLSQEESEITTFSTNSDISTVLELTTKYEETLLDNTEITHGMIDSNNEAENINKSNLEIYSAKSDIGLKYLNYSSEESSTILPIKETLTFHDEYVTGIVYESEETAQGSLTENTIREESTSESVSVTDQLFEFNNFSTFESSEIFSTLRNHEAPSDVEDDSSLSVGLNNSIVYSKPVLNNINPVFDYELDTVTTGEEKQTTSLDITNPSTSPTIHLSTEKPYVNPISLHIQEGHGFYRPVLPLKESLVEYLDTKPETEVDSTSDSLFAIKETKGSLFSDKNLSIDISTDLPVKSQTFSQTTNPVTSSISDESILELRDEETVPNFTYPSVENSEMDLEPQGTTTKVSMNKKEDSVGVDDYEKLAEDHSSRNESTTLVLQDLTSAFETSQDDFSITTESATKFGETSASSTDLNEGASNDSSIVFAGVPKIVPQLSDLSFNPNDIDSDDKIFIGPNDDLLDEDRVNNYQTGSVEDVSKEGFVEIIRHITTVPPTVPSFAISLGKHPIFISQNCSEDEMQCDSGECVDSTTRCNMRRDCRDNSDEKNCACSELLKVMGQSQKICDGVEDCRDHSDEQNCPWCDEGQIICPQTKFCINQSQVCDGHNDCPLGTDERYCVKLAESISDAEGMHYRSNGYLMVRKQGQWGKLCLDNLQNSDALRLKLDDLGEAVCSALTYRNVSESRRTQDPESVDKSYYVISNEVSSQTKRSSAIFQPSTCESKEVMRVQCGSLDCGLRPMATSSRRRIVGGQSAGSGSWPWQVALYKEGDFQCGAVLVSDTWLISAGHCFYSTQDAHWIARLGLLRRGSELPSPSEQIRRIERIFLHPNYVDKGFINDIALLKLDKPVLFSDYLRPVCLPTEDEDVGQWHGKQCSVVGWGKLYEIGHTFPDSLQEVRLPVISTEECRKKIIFLTMYHITDNMFCAGYERGGRDACLGDSGGPLMCQRDDGRWLLLGVTSNGDGCGRPGRPGVYTKVAQYLGWVTQIMEAKYPAQAFEDVCEGIRCKLGRCVPPYKMCDNRWDCSEGTDEDHCDD